MSEQPKYNLGEFVQFHFSDLVFEPQERPIIGVVNSITSEQKRTARAFLFNELPKDIEFLTTDELTGRTELLNYDQGMHYLTEMHSQFGEEIKRGNLLGAVAARKQFHLAQFLAPFKLAAPDKAINPFVALTNAHLEPTSGVYVIAGEYASEICLEERYLQGLLINHEPKIAYESQAANALYLFYPDGLGSIPKKIDTGELTGYHAFEVPNEHKHLIGARIKILTLQLR